MILASLILSIGSVFAAAFLDWKQKSPFFMLWPLGVLFFYLPLVVYWLDGEYPDYVIFEAFLYSSLCNFAYIVGVSLAAFLAPSNAASITGLNVFPSRAKDIVIVTAILAVPLILIMNGVSVQRILGSTLSDKRELSSWYLIIILIASFLIPQIVYSVKNKKIWMTLGIALIFLMVALYFRSRSILVLLCLPVGYYFLMFTKSGGVKIFLLGVIAFFLSVILKVVRYQGELRDGLDFSQWGESFRYVMSEQFASGDFSISKVFLSVIQDCSVQAWCGSMSFFNKVASNLGLYPKENTIEYELYDFYVQSGVGGSLHPTGYGFSYADFGGFGGVILFLLLAFYRAIIHKVLMGSNRNFAYLGFIMYFVLFFSRGSVYNSFMLLSLAAIFEVMIAWGLFLLSKRKSI